MTAHGCFVLCIEENMQLPPFCAKSAFIYMVGVIAMLLIAYFLVSAIFNSQPHIRIHTQPTSSSTPS